MSKNREFVSSVGTGADLLQKLAQAVYAKGGADEDLVRIISDEALRTKIASLIVGEKPVVQDSYRIAVDWNRSLAQMIEAGRYDWVNPDITRENFPLTPPPAETSGPDAGPYRTSGKNGDAETEALLVHYGKYMTTRAIEADLDRRGLRPATLAELLVLGEKHPDLQLRFSIVALGSFWVYRDGNRDVPCLFGYSGERELSLRWGDPVFGWHGRYRFLAVRKS